MFATKMGVQTTNNLPAKLLYLTQYRLYAEIKCCCGEIKLFPIYKKKTDGFLIEFSQLMKIIVCCDNLVWNLYRWTILNGDFDFSPTLNGNGIIAQTNFSSSVTVRFKKGSFSLHCSNWQHTFILCFKFVIENLGVPITLASKPCLNPSNSVMQWI